MKVNANAIILDGFYFSSNFYMNGVVPVLLYSLRALTHHYYGVGISLIPFRGIFTDVNCGDIWYQILERLYFRQCADNDLLRRSGLPTKDSNVDVHTPLLEWCPARRFPSAITGQIRFSLIGDLSGLS